MKRSCLIERCGQVDFVKTIEEVLDADATLGAAVPLLENTVQVCARGVLAS